nr:hypothetical protein [Candidatus Enterousia merdequi]
MNILKSLQSYFESKKTDRDAVAQTKTENTKSSQKTINQEDVGTIAVLCFELHECVRTRLSRKAYFYYIPNDTSKIQYIKDIFVKNCVPVKEHMSSILGREQTVLRCCYDDITDQYHAFKFINEVKQKNNQLFTLTLDKREERRILLQKIQEQMKQK